MDPHLLVFFFFFWSTTKIPLLMMETLQEGRNINKREEKCKPSHGITKPKPCWWGTNRDNHLQNHTHSRNHSSRLAYMEWQISTPLCYRDSHLQKHTHSRIHNSRLAHRDWQISTQHHTHSRFTAAVIRLTHSSIHTAAPQISRLYTPIISDHTPQSQSRIQTQQAISWIETMAFLKCIP